VSELKENEWNIRMDIEMKDSCD